MHYWLIAALLTSGSATLGILIRRLVWLAGLHRVLSDTAPDERAAILTAYAKCQPPAGERRYPGVATRHRPVGGHR